MNPTKFRSLCTVALATAILISVPAEAKRRTVRHSAPLTAGPGMILGLVLDNVTGQPVRLMTVYAGPRATSTDEFGRFQFKNLDTTKPIAIETERSGYLPLQFTVQPNQSRDLTIRVIPTQTISVRSANGQVVQLDTESVKFGYPVPFSGYRESEIEDFCKVSDHSAVAINKSQMKRLAGPAQLVSHGGCCDSGNAAKMTLTLRTNETFDVLFTDTCEERYKVDVGGRDHVTGQFVHILITDIVEMIFP